MKLSRKFIFGSFLFVGLQFGLSSCVSDGYVGVHEGVYYGPRRDPWFRDDPWMDGHGWYGGPRSEVNVGVYIHPPRRRW